MQAHACHSASMGGSKDDFPLSVLSFHLRIWKSIKLGLSALLSKRYAQWAIWRAHRQGFLKHCYNRLCVTGAWSWGSTIKRQRWNWQGRPTWNPVQGTPMRVTGFGKASITHSWSKFPRIFSKSTPLRLSFCIFKHKRQHTHMSLILSATPGTTSRPNTRWLLIESTLHRWNYWGKGHILAQPPSAKSWLWVDSAITIRRL